MYLFNGHAMISQDCVVATDQRDGRKTMKYIHVQCDQSSDGVSMFTLLMPN